MADYNGPRDSTSLSGRSICYYGTFSRGEEYSRTEAFLRALRSLGASVHMCNVPLGQGADGKIRLASSFGLSGLFSLLWKQALLAARYLRVPPHDAVMVGNPGHLDMPIAFLLSRLRSVPLVFDAFYSLYDTVVLDRKLVPEGSVRARIVLALDKLSCRLADLVLVDTGAAARFFAELLGVPEGKMVVVPPGVPEAFLDPAVQPKRVFPPDTVECLFYGSYVPLQGADTIVRASGILQDRTDVRLVMIGEGQDKQRVQRIADSEGLCNVEFLPWMEPHELAAHVKGADVCLGIFGTSQKAHRVVPYKVYGYMSLGKALITMDSEAAREVLVDESSALLVPPGDPEALARAVSALACDAGLRKQMGGSARDAFERTCTVETIAEDLRGPIARTIEEHGG